MAKMNSIRILLSLAANLEWPLHQFDVKNAFLRGDLEEEVYMDILPSLESNHLERGLIAFHRLCQGMGSNRVKVIIPSLLNILPVEK